MRELFWTKSSFEM